jgi:choline dehydrogenase-like flavoprotein
MGKASDSRAVVDEKLCVRGVGNLRVVDCSIMPTLHGGHTQMPAYGIAEKAADMIKEKWGLCGREVGCRNEGGGARRGDVPAKL